jgi:formylglycine-generating enzyme required for sulfatase activity
MKIRWLLLICSPLLLTAQSARKNSIGIDLLPIPAGHFQMGSTQAEYDEQPVHRVSISRSFRMSATEITNAQYELFRPEHRILRGMQRTSYRDDDPVVFVSWDDAMAFCRWLSKKEGRHYRLPTEAEWEYACRAGTTTHYFTGDTLPAVYRKYNPAGHPSGFSWASPLDLPEAPDLRVQQTPPNAWGLFDMHGNVEEWCLDAYASYPSGTQTDPLVTAGSFRITRGGSHTTEADALIQDADPMRRLQARYLSSSNRMAALPADRNWLIGFRIVEAAPVEWPTAHKQPLPVSASPRTAVPQVKNPYFSGPIPFIRPSKNASFPFYYHHHQPAVTELPNGDLLAIWYNTVRESGRELQQLYARKKAGTDYWSDAERFFDVADRNEHGSLIWSNGKDTVFHISGISAGNTWYALALIMRFSTDNGYHWSEPKFIDPLYRFQNQVVASMIRTQAGQLFFSCDASPESWGGTVVWTSANQGRTWSKPAEGKRKPVFAEGKTGAWIAGIHAPIVETTDGLLLAFGRGDNIEGHQIRSSSTDGGHSWTYTKSHFPAIGSGQRSTMQRLPNGHIVFASFAKDLTYTDAAGNERKASGLYVALSMDNGQTFPIIRPLVNEPGQSRELNAWGWQHRFTWTDSTAEPKGYLCSTLSSDGLIHVLSSGLEYTFNEAWLLNPTFKVGQKP